MTSSKDLKIIFPVCLLFLLVTIIVVSCCKKNPIPPDKICGTNEILIGNKCVCDNNSSNINGKCEYVVPNWNTWADGGAQYCFKTVSKNCNDWRDSVLMPFTDTDFKIGFKGLTCAIGDVKSIGGGIIDVDYYNELPLYDTLASESYFQMTNGVTITAGLYMRITKNRDSIYATICRTQWTPFYKRLDTCKSVLIRAL